MSSSIDCTAARVCGSMLCSCASLIMEAYVAGVLHTAHRHILQLHNERGIALLHGVGWPGREPLRSHG
jgi:hypothetical protein